MTPDTGSRSVTFLRRLLGIFGAARMRRRVDEEIRAHLEMRADEYQRQGMSHYDARRSAAHRFGSITQVVQACYSVHHIPMHRRFGVELMNTMWQDIRYAARGFVRNPSFTAIAVFTLMLGIGGNTAIFSAVNAILLNPMPFPGGDRFAFVWMQHPRQQIMVRPDAGDLAVWQTDAQTVEAFQPYHMSSVSVTGGIEPRSVMLGQVTPSMFQFLGVSPVRGRRFLPDDVSRQEKVLLVSYAFWQVELGGAADVLERTIELDEISYRVIGVMPRRASRFWRDVNVPFWAPLEIPADDEDVSIVVRVRPDVTDSVANAELAQLRSNRDGLDEEKRAWNPQIQSATGFISKDLRRGLWVLFAAVGCVLLIACANVANMLLARSVARSHEVALRASLGASRWRIARQLLMEHLVLGLVGSLAALAFAQMCITILRRFTSTELSELQRVHIEPSVLGFTLVLGVSCSLLFGMAPLWQLRGLDMSAALKQCARGGDGRGGVRLRQALVVVEVAAALVLFFGAGLLVRTLGNLMDQDPGFRSEQLATVRVMLPTHRYQTESERALFVNNLRDRLESIPLFEQVAFGIIAPPQFGAMFGEPQVEGQSLDTERKAEYIAGNWVTPGFFSVAGIPVLEGQITDVIPTGASYAVVSEGFADGLWPNQSAVGKRFRMGSNQEWKTVTAVVRGISTLRRPNSSAPKQIYMLHASLVGERFTVVARTAVDAAAAISVIKEQMWALDPTLSLEAASVDQILSDSVARPRFNAMLLSLFALLALVLAAVGAYGVISLNVQHRQRELGVRIALGARTNQVRRLMLVQGIVPVVGGVILGTIAALGVGRMLSSMLFGVGAMDVGAYVLAAAALLATGLLASYLPAIRATRVDPVTTLRAD